MKAADLIPAATAVLAMQQGRAATPASGVGAAAEPVRPTNNTIASLHPELRSQDLVPTVEIIFHSMPKLVFSLGEWEAAGGYHKVLKDYALSVRDIKKVERTAMTVHDFAQLEEWCG